MTDKEKLLKLIKHYDAKKNRESVRKNSFLDQGIDRGVAFERAKTREKDYYYMIQNLNILLNDGESEFY